MNAMEEGAKIGAEAFAAFNKWKEIHTLDNRTPREMFMFGFYEGRETCESTCTHKNSPMK